MRLGRCPTARLVGQELWASDSGVEIGGACTSWVARRSHAGGRRPERAAAGPGAREHTRIGRLLAGTVSHYCLSHSAGYPSRQRRAAAAAPRRPPARRPPPRRPPPGLAQRSTRPGSRPGRAAGYRQQYPDCHRCPNGSTACTANPPSDKGPVSNLPLKTATRSRSPRQPPPPVSGGGGSGRRGAMSQPNQGQTRCRVRVRWANAPSSSPPSIQAARSVRTISYALAPVDTLVPGADPFWSSETRKLISSPAPRPFRSPAVCDRCTSLFLAAGRKMSLRSSRLAAARRRVVTRPIGS